MVSFVEFFFSLIFNLHFRFIWSYADDWKAKKGFGIFQRFDFGFGKFLFNGKLTDIFRNFLKWWVEILLNSNWSKCRQGWGKKKLVRICCKFESDIDRREQNQNSSIFFVNCSGMFVKISKFTWKTLNSNIQWIAEWAPLIPDNSIF